MAPFPFLLILDRRPTLKDLYVLYAAVLSIYAAELAGMKRPNFIRLMRELGIPGHREQRIVVSAS